jgi:hypothetical protein
MKKLFMLMIGLGIATSGTGQNLVSNASFETKEPGTGCPNQTGFDNGRPAGWTIASVNGFTPDYFFPCASPGSAWYPGSNSQGCEYPLQGQAYTGLLAMLVSNGNVLTAGSEYMQQQINLTANQQYYVEFWVSAANINSNNTFVKTLGMYFKRQDFDISQGVNKGLHHLVPQIPNTFPATNFYSNTNGWAKISGTFTPNQTGTWTIIIGNFDSGLNNNPPTPISSPSTGNRQSYYYIDAVTVQTSGQSTPDYTTLINGSSTVCTSSSTYSLQNQPFGTSVTWSSSNSSGLSINATTGVATRMNNFTGQVTLTATMNGACGTTNVTKNVNIGNYTPIGLSSVQSNCSGNTFNTLNTSLSGACTANTSIYFTYNITDTNYTNLVFTPVSVPSGASWSVNGRILNMTVNTPSSQGSRSATIALSATGPCGPYNVNFTSTAVNYYSGGYSYSTYPNPASETLTIEQISSEEENSDVSTFHTEGYSKSRYYRLYDFNSNKVVCEGSLSHKIGIDVSDLNKGRYILKIQLSENKEEIHQVIIK